MESDHRAVSAKMRLREASIPSNRWKRRKVKRGWKPSESYHDELSAKLQSTMITSLKDFGDVLVEAAELSTVESKPQGICKPWQSIGVKRLVNERRGCTDSIRRRQLSKDIFRIVRNATREYQSDQTTRILARLVPLSSA